MKTHKLSKHPLYRKWSSIKTRCYNPKCKDWPYYGQKGVTMCKAWRGSFLAFYKWCIKTGWVEGMEIDRKNNNRGYTPKNCRWADRKTQANNMTTNIRVEHDGSVITLAQLADVLGMQYSDLYNRFKRGQCEYRQAI